jgi:hypothetical protein
MANLITETRVDDLLYKHDGEEVAAEETVEFSLDGKHWKVDLTRDHAEKLRQALQPFISVATPQKAGSPRRTRAEMKDLRTWAREHGWQLSDRGRIPDEAREAYDKREIEGSEAL